MDWSPTSATELVTAGSQDKFIKVWDYEQHQTIMSQRVAFPVWKIKYTPFGKGLVSISKKDNQVRVWRLNHPQGGSSNHMPKESPSTSSATSVEPIENISIFSGHTDEIKCLDFRTIESNNQHQLVTWSKDMSIRFWNFTQQIMEDLTSNVDGITSANNSKDNNSSSLDKNFIPSRSPIGMMSLHLLGNEWSITSVPDHIFETDPSALFEQTVIGSPVTRLTFDQEIEKIISVFNNLKFCTRVKANQNDKSENIECETKITLEKMDKSEQARYCILGIIMIVRAASSPNLPVAINDLKLKVTFPKLYPINAAPSFDFLPSRSFISVQDLKTIKQALTTAAHDDVLKHHNCMLSCFRSLVSILGKLKWRERRENEQDSISAIGMNSFNSPSSLGMPKVLSSANLVATNFSKAFDSDDMNDKQQQSTENTPDSVVNLLKDKPVSQDEHNYIAHPISGARFSPSGDLIYFNSCSLRSRKNREDASNKNDKRRNDVDFGYRYYLDMVQELKTPFSLSIKSRSKEHGDETQEKRRKKSTKKDKKYLKNGITNSMNSSMNEAMTISQDLSTNSDMKHDSSDLIDGIKDMDKERDNNYFSSVYNDYHDDSTEEDSYYSAEFDDDSSEEGHTSYFSNHGYMGEEENGEDSNFSADQKRHIFFNDTRTDPRIHIYDSKYLLPVSYSLAQKYRVIGNSAVDVCLYNSQVCLDEGNHELAKMWKILSLILDPRLFYDRTKSNTVKASAVWSNHALGRRFVKKLLTHFLSKHDIQTCAIISCVLKLSYQLVSLEIVSNSQTPNIILNQHLNFDVGPKSRPWDFIPITSNNAEMSKEKIELIASTDLLEKDLKPVMTHVRLCYAKLLQSWGLHLQRCEIMKYNESSQASRRFMNGTSECVIDVETTAISPATVSNIDSSGTRRSNSTTSNTTSLQSPLTPHSHQPMMNAPVNPKKSFLHCSLCRIPVKGLVSYCPNCNHGGHVEHIQNWFKSHEACPAGCNCKCSSFMVFYPVSSPTPGQVKNLSVSTTTNGNAISAVNVDRTPEHSSTFSIKKQSVTPNPQQRNDLGGINSVLSFLNL